MNSFKKRREINLFDRQNYCIMIEKVLQYLSLTELGVEVNCFAEY